MKINPEFQATATFSHFSSIFQLGENVPNSGVGMGMDARPKSRNGTSRGVLAQRPTGLIHIPRSRGIACNQLVFLSPVFLRVQRGKLRRLEHSPAGWQSFRCGGHRFIYSGGGRDAFQKLLVAPVAHVRAYRPLVSVHSVPSAFIRLFCSFREHL